MNRKMTREIDAFRQYYQDTTDPNVTARSGVKVLSYYNGHPVVRDSFPGRYFLTCKDELGCYVWVPCDQHGVAIPVRYIDES
jgi:hypothetical protein